MSMFTTRAEMEAQGFKKIGHNGGSFVTGFFYNPVTHETRTEVLRDYDYADGSRDNDDLYYMEEDEEARKAYEHHMGFVLVGDLIEVYKGRKVPIGTKAKIVKIEPWYDANHRWKADYAILDNGMRTNVNNCRLVEEI